MLYNFLYGLYWTPHVLFLCLKAAIAESSVLRCVWKHDYQPSERVWTDDIGLRGYYVQPTMECSRCGTSYENGKVRFE